MAHFDYKDSPYPIREDIGETLRAFWARLAAAGSWWTGDERVKIAAECRAARDCAFCKTRQEALSPYTGENNHGAVTDLPASAVDAVHRIVTDQTRITRNWIEGNAAGDLSIEKYVELAGIVVAVLSIDEFNRALGVPFEPLPEPVAGEPDRYVPANLETGTGFVPMIAADGAVGNESDLWSPNFAANVIRALSLVPNAVRDWVDLAGALYLNPAGMANFVGQDDRSIDRAQMEIVAGRVSSYNECFY